jgi:monoamine oxidase
MPSGERVAVIGAGLAGLTCAYRLRQRGIDVTLCEANTRLGGRCWTNRTSFDGGQLLAVSYTIEYGGEVQDQSALNLIYLLGVVGQGQLRLFGPSNEKYKVRGGNDRIVSGLAGARGILVDYTGAGVTLTQSGRLAAALAPEFLERAEPVFPGLTAQWNGKATFDDWPRNPWTLGSYSYFRVRQYQRFAGAERESVGSCHFAGEHTSIDAQDYLEGPWRAESERRARCWRRWG